MEEKELEMWDWTKKINERLTFLILKVQDRKDIAETDYDLLRVLYPIWYNQEYPLFVTKMEGIATSVTQSSIFDAISSDTQPKECNGTVVAQGDAELITDNDE